MDMQRKKIVALRLTEEEYYLLEAKADLYANGNVSALLREWIKTIKPKEKLKKSRKTNRSF